MKRLLMATAISAAAAFGAYAQTADKDPQGSTESIQKPSGDYEHPPAGRMDAATPPMAPDDPAKKGASTTEVPPSDQGAASTGAASGQSGAAGPAIENIFTSDQARQHLMRLGFTNVSALDKDADGKWVGTATKDGKTLAVAIDVKGEVRHR